MEGSGRLWCRHQVRFNKVPEKVPEKIWEALVQSQVRFNRVSEGLGGLVQSRVKFNRVLEKVPDKVWEALVQSQVRLDRVPEKVPQKVPEKVWETLVQSHIRFNRVPEKVPEKVPGEALVQSQVGDQPGFGKCLGEGSGEDLGDFGADPEGSGRLWCRAGLGSTRFSGRLWWRGGPGSTRFRRRFWRRFRKVLVRPGSTRLQVGSGAIPGLCRRRFRSSSSKIRTNKIMTIIYCCCKLVFF